MGELGNPLLSVRGGRSSRKDLDTLGFVHGLHVRGPANAAVCIMLAPIAATVQAHDAARPRAKMLPYHGIVADQEAAQLAKRRVHATVNGGGLGHGPL